MTYDQVIDYIRRIPSDVVQNEVAEAVATTLCQLAKGYETLDFESKLPTEKVREFVQHMHNLGFMTGYTAFRDKPTINISR